MFFFSMKSHFLGLAFAFSVDFASSSSRAVEALFREQDRVSLTMSTLGSEGDLVW